MRYLNIILLLLFACSFSYGKTEKNISGAKELLERLSKDVIKIMKTKDGEERHNSLYALFEGVYHDRVPHLILGKEKRSIKNLIKKHAKTPEEKKSLVAKTKMKLQDFYRACKRAVIHGYVSSFEKQYEGEVLKIKRAYPVGRRIRVKSDLDRPNKKVSIDWDFEHACPKGQKKCSGIEYLKISDVVVENLSNIRAKRDEAQSIIEKAKTGCEGKECIFAGLERITAKYNEMTSSTSKAASA